MRLVVFSFASSERHSVCQGSVSPSYAQLGPVKPRKGRGKAQSRTRRDDVKERHRNANKDRSAFAAEAFKTGFSILEFLQYN